MKRKETSLLVENWRTFINEASDDEDIYAPLDGEPDQLDRDFDSVKSQIDMYKESDAEREAMKERFRKMFNISEEDMELFLANQAFEAGYDMQGDEFDSSVTPDDMSDVSVEDIN